MFDRPKPTVGFSANGRRRIVGKESDAASSRDWFPDASNERSASILFSDSVAFCNDAVMTSNLALWHLR